jgi:hypothetical protein
MPYRDPRKQKEYCRNYQALKRKILANSNQVVRTCEHCGILTIQEVHDDIFKCLKCESVTQ